MATNTFARHRSMTWNGHRVDRAIAAADIHRKVRVLYALRCPWTLPRRSWILLLYMMKIKFTFDFFLFN
jgi:hypothetical protein